jgi:hypothetical protein
VSGTDELYFDAVATHERSIPKDTELELISTLARLAQSTQSDVDDLERLVEEKKKKIREILTRDLPQAMADVGLDSFSLDSGSSVSLKNEVYASIPEKSRRECLDWLRDNGFGDIIKNEFKINLGRGEDDKASSLSRYLSEVGVAYSEKEGVHPQTLQAFVREQDSRGLNVPDDLFAIYRGQVAKLKVARKEN